MVVRPIAISLNYYLCYSLLLHIPSSLTFRLNKIRIRDDHTREILFCFPDLLRFHAYIPALP